MSFDDAIKQNVLAAIKSGTHANEIINPLLFHVAGLIVALNRQQGTDLEDLVEQVRHTLDEHVAERNIAYDRN